MSAEIALGVADRSRRVAASMVARLTARKAIRSGVLWGYIFGIFVASSALSYTGIYKTGAERHQLAASFASNHAAIALFGPAPQLQTVAGFTAFKTFLTLSLIGAVWGFLTSTRLLRGEEEGGRWELILSGQTTRKGAVAQALLGLAAGVFTIWAITGLVTVVTGLSSTVNIAAGPALYFALALVSSAIMFIGVGAVTSQLADTRRRGALYAASFLGVCYAVRLVADAGIGFHWLIWASPLGWVEQLGPLTHPQPLAFLPIVGFTAILVVCALRLAEARDVGAGTITDPDRSRPHLRLLFSSLGLTLRTLRAGAIECWVSIAITGVLTGMIAKAAGESISGTSVKRVFAKLGAHGAGAEAFLVVSFLIMAVLIAVVATGQITALRSEESEGRLDNLLVRPVSRFAWFGERLLVAAAIVLVGGLVAGCFVWIGAASQDTGVPFPTLVTAGLSIVPPAIFVLGVGALTIGVWPRATTVIVYGVVGWSLLIELGGGIGALGPWLLDTSLFHQMAAAPAAAPNWLASGVMVGIGVAAGLLGDYRFSRRDLARD